MFQYYLFNYINNSLIIDFLWLFIILSSIGVILSHNAVVSVVYLLSVYILISIYLYFIGLSVIGLLYLMVYVGAITVLFLFVLSLLDLGESELKRASFIPDILSLIFSIFLIFNIFVYSNLSLILSSDNLNYFFFLFLSFFNYDLINFFNTEGYLFNSNINISYFTIDNWFNINPITEFKIIGELLYTDFSFLFIILGLMLLFSVISAIVLLFQLQDSDNLAS